MQFLSSRKSKIAELHPAVASNENIVRLEVSMYHSRRMNEIDSTQQIVQDCCDMLITQLRISILEKLMEIKGHIVHDQENWVKLL